MALVNHVNGWVLVAGGSRNVLFRGNCVAAGFKRIHNRLKNGCGDLRRVRGNLGRVESPVFFVLLSCDVSVLARVKACDHHCPWWPDRCLVFLAYRLVNYCRDYARLQGLYPCDREIPRNCVVWYTYFRSNRMAWDFCVLSWGMSGEC